MMKTKEKISDSYEKHKTLLKRLSIYFGYGIGAAILFSMLLIVLFQDFIINYTFKERIIKGFEEANPEYSIWLSRIHFNVWENRLSLDSLQIRADDSSFTCRADSLSVTGITWLKIILKRDYSTNLFQKSALDARKITLNFQKSQYSLGLQKLHLSVVDSELTAELINYSPLINDEQIFAKSQFRQTRFRFDIPALKITGLDCLSLLKGKLYKAKSINASNMFADILVNMDKPYEKGSANPQMPNELFSSLKEEIKIDSIKITNGRLKYCEK
ncbi:MAG TPA: hypothetical protein DCE80_15540, partial [Ignavibacteriales bacterium]|nr:hypothetical protein [Ignavibacteriales bacterium]